MRDLFDFILNTILGVRFRFRNKMTIGEGTNFLKSFGLISKSNKNNVVIGNDCLLGAKLIAEGSKAYFKFGDRVYIGNSKLICRTGIEFESDILVAWGVTFYDHDSHSLDYTLRQEDIKQQVYDFKNYEGNLIKNKNWEVVNTKPIKICKNAWIGMNAVILKGVTIGEGAIVGACSVVTKDVAAFTVVAGNPAKVVKQLNPSSTYKSQFEL